VLKEKEIYFKTKYRPAGILHNVNAVICFELKLLLKVRNNKNYFSVIVIVCHTNRGRSDGLQLYLWE
jgi:hypothetical protein